MIEHGLEGPKFSSGSQIAELGRSLPGDHNRQEIEPKTGHIIN